MSVGRNCGKFGGIHGEYKKEIPIFYGNLCCNFNISAFPFRREKRRLKILPLITLGED